MRAAYLHGPYTLYAACYPATFNPDQKQENQDQEGAPDYEPQLKAGGHWGSKLKIPDDVRATAGGPRSGQGLDSSTRSFTWIIEVASQIIFSTTATVHFEILVARDERSVDLGFHGIVGEGQEVRAPGSLQDHQQGRARRSAQPKGVFSKAVTLRVDDTESLWNTPPFPSWDEEGKATAEPYSTTVQDQESSTMGERRKRKKVHLVVITHGLHSNLGADMLYLKESIDAAAKQAREDAKARREELKRKDAEKEALESRQKLGRRSNSVPEAILGPISNVRDVADDNDEQVIVRGFNGNAVRTERGIQYLGKRLAKYVLSITYPDQPYLPVKSSISRAITRSFMRPKSEEGQTLPIHRHSSVVKDEEHTHGDLAYSITSISFISHSLGGNIQTYAIAYIQKHSPEFFEKIKPINFVAMATPFLGLSNENPIYVKFALDFGLVGRTGQDLGLTWRAPTVVRGGWQTMIGGLGRETQKAQRQQPDPGTKPLLRILPTGPAHVALKKFRNRSVYSNVVNDGIVPLRTSCLLFLDWRGLGRVEKARRENGIVGTMVGWGWSEMMGQNASAPRKSKVWNDLFGDSGEDNDTKPRKRRRDRGQDVPQAEASASLDEEPENSQFLDSQRPRQDGLGDHDKTQQNSKQQPTTPWAGFLALFKPQAAPKAHHQSPRQQKIYSRGQTMYINADEERPKDDSAGQVASTNKARRGLVRGSSLYTENGELEAPPKTTFFESAGDLLNPPLPPKEFLMNPAARPRTIFHDQVYHPEDIPAPPAKRRKTSVMKRTLSHESLLRSNSLDEASHLAPDRGSLRTLSSASDVDTGGMKIEEKIARAYHKDMSWRKVLVRLEPDAHNNMVVRRMFANAYGWPVVKHLCDTHFAYTAAAETADSEESHEERAQPLDTKVVNGDGEHVRGQEDLPAEDVELEGQRRGSHHDLQKDDGEVHDLHEGLEKLKLEHERSMKMRRTESEMLESKDEVRELIDPILDPAAAGSSHGSSFNTPHLTVKSTSSSSRLLRQDSAKWSDRFFEGSDDDSTDDEQAGRFVAEPKRMSDSCEGAKKGTSEVEIADFLTKSRAQSTIDLPSLKETSIRGKSQQQIEGNELLVDVNGSSAQSPREKLGPARIGLGIGFDKSGCPHVVSESPAQERGIRKDAEHVGVAEQVALAAAKKEERYGDRR